MDNHNCQPVLSIRNLQTWFPGKKHTVKAVNGVSLDVYPGRITALIGGSGSGKSVMSLSILGLIDPPGRIVGGEVLLNGRDLRKLSEKEMQKVRGREIAMIFQEPTSALNPVLKIKNHMLEALKIHDSSVTMKNSWKEFNEALQRVGLSESEKILESYPFELSGGMCQRVMVAMGLITKANVIIADEPTSSLDLTTQAAILEELERIRDLGVGIILITHDLGVVAQTADYMYVIKDGIIVEHGDVETVFHDPQNEYTRKLMEHVDLRSEYAKEKQDEQHGN